MSENPTPAGDSAVLEVHTVDSILGGIGYAGFVRAMFNRTGDFPKDFAHAVLGIATEVYELRHATDKVNQIEEAGDLTFYSYALWQVVGDYLAVNVADFDARRFGDNDLSDEISGGISASQEGSREQYLDLLINELLDAAKRWVGYGRPPADILEAMLKGRYIVNEAMKESGYPMPSHHILCINIAKLLERYNGLKFTADAAINRDVAVERTVMENAGA